MAAKKTTRRAAVKRKTPAARGNGPTLKAMRNKQTKSEIVRTVAEDTGLSRVQVQSVLASISGLAKRHIMKRGSGEFAVPEMGIKIRRVHRKARIARNPMTGEPVRVPAKTAVKATVLKALKEAAA